MMHRLLSSILVVAAIAVAPATASAASSTYQIKSFSITSSGGQGSSPWAWYASDNNWGYNNTSDQGFYTLYLGNQWGWQSPSWALPKYAWELGSKNITSSFGENHTVNSGGWVDACWDNFCDSKVPNDRNGALEIMVWTAYQGTQPISYTWNSNGTAKPYKTGQWLSGKAWNVYTGSQNMPGAPDGKMYTASFLAQNHSGDTTIKPMEHFNWCVDNKAQLGGNTYGPNWNWYVLSIGAGWEFKNGKGNCWKWNIWGL